MPKSTAASILPQHADHDALNLHLLRIDEDRLHRGVRRLEAHLAARIAIELLQRDVRAAEESDHHLAVFGRLAVLDHDEVAIANLLVDHRVAADTEDVRDALSD